MYVAANVKTRFIPFINYITDSYTLITGGILLCRNLRLIRVSGVFR